ncbi:MAG: ANTAR domain-containing protein [Lachnospiraceae bacterium]|nr:ANTAR domain-containing protein [Lachnospiraceae bacterium]
MPKNESILHSMLVVSGSDNIDAVIKSEVPVNHFMTIDIKRSAALARRLYFEKYYDIIVVNFPLTDETGLEFAIDIAEKGSSSVLVLVSNNQYGDILERVTDYGILAVAKPCPRGRISHAVRYLMAEQEKRQSIQKKLDKAEEKLTELRIVSKAKILLVEKRQMTEDEAHRYIGKCAMDQGVSRKRVAEELLDDLED